MFHRWLSYQQPTWLIGILFLIGFVLDAHRVMTSKEARASIRQDSSDRSAREEGRTESEDVCETH